MPSVSKNIFWLSISRVFALVMLFFAYTQLFRYLGPFGTGQYQFVLSYVTIFAVISDLGISQYIVKKISEEPQSVKKYFHNFLATEIILVVIIYFLMVGFSYFRGYEPVVVQAIAVAGLGTMLSGLAMPFLSVLSAFQDLKRVAIINFAASVINVSVIALAIIFDRYIVFLALNQAIFSVLSLVLYYSFIKRYIPHPEILKTIRSADWQLLKKILHAALPFALLVSFSTIYNRIDVVLITKILGYESTGLYTAAYKFVDLMNFFPAVVSASLYPAFAGLMSRGLVAEARALLEKYLRLLIVVALPIGVGGSLLSRELITIVAGQEFARSAVSLSILVWAIAILFVYIVANALVISQLTKFAVIITGINVLVNIIGNILLLPVIGIKGAAIMTVVSEFLQGIFYFYFIRKKITIFSVWPVLAKPVFGVMVMGFVIWYARSFLDMGLLLNFIILLVIGGVVYLICLVATGFFRKEDLQFVKSMLGKGSVVGKITA